MVSQNPIFIPGPTNIPDAVRHAIDVPMEDMRAPDFPAFTLPLFADVRKVLATRTGEVFLIPGSGTLGWEGAIANTLCPGDRVLTCRLGQFSTLWSTMCERFGLEVVNVDVEWGHAIPADRFARILADDKGHRIKAVLACHNETATGVTSDIAAVRAALDACDHPALLFVDGVSSIASIDFRMDAWGVDVAVAGSQKGFMLPAGLAIVGVSQKAMACGKTATLPRYTADFAAMRAANAGGYFPYTPVTNLMRGLRCSLDLLLAEGLPNVYARHHRMAQGVRRAVAAWGLSLCAADPATASDTVSAICVPTGVDPAAVVRAAYEHWGLSLGVGLAKVADRVFRIGHLGATTELMILSGIAGAELALRDAGARIELGSGVAAAQAWYEQSRPAAARAAAAE